MYVQLCKKILTLICKVFYYNCCKQQKTLIKMTNITLLDGSVWTLSNLQPITVQNSEFCGYKMLLLTPQNPENKTTIHFYINTELKDIVIDENSDPDIAVEILDIFGDRIYDIEVVNSTRKSEIINNFGKSCYKKISEESGHNVLAGSSHEESESE